MTVNQSIHAIFENGVCLPVVPMELQVLDDLFLNLARCQCHAARMALPPNRLRRMENGFEMSMHYSASGIPRDIPIPLLGRISIRREWRIS